MNPDNLRRLLHPRHIAFIGGADADFAARQCAAQFDGPVWGVNPKRERLGGVPCYPGVADLPEAPDAVFLATPRGAATDTVRELARIGAGGIACFTAGYGELGAAGQRAEAELVEAAGDMALVGPNCYGLVNFTNGAVLWPFGAGNQRCHEGVALVMQSGMLPANMTMNDRSVPITHVVSAGNQAVLAIEDYVDVLLDEPGVRAIGLYIEGIKDIGKFAAAAIKALRLDKPIVVLKAGRSKLGERISVTHTGSLAGADAAFQALFERYAMIRVESPVAMIETLKLVSVAGAPRGKRLAAFTCSGGDAAMVADYCERIGLELKQPSAPAVARLEALLPDIATAANPLDYTTPLWGNAEVMPQVFETLIADDYDAAVVIQDFPPGHIHADNRHYRADAASFITACGRVGIPGAVCSDLPENIDRESRELLIAGGVAPLQGLDAGLDAIAGACAYGSSRERILRQETMLELDLADTPAGSSDARIVDEWRGKQRLREFGIDVPAGKLVALEQIDAVADELTYPVALKAVAAGLAHKSEAGAVRLNLRDAAELKRAADAMQQALASSAPALELREVLVEEMIDGVVAELMLGIDTDPQFGQLLVIASGGVLVELTRDAQTLLLPASDAQLREALRRLRCFALLRGYRGKPAANLDRVVATMRRLIDFAGANRGSLLELDVNPLMVTRDACIAADVLIRET